MGSPESVESDASNPQHPALDRKPYYTFSPQVQAEYPVVVQAVQVRSRTRYIGAITLAVAATVAIIHGIYFTIDDHPVAFPMMNQVTIGIAIFAYLGAAMALRGRHFLMAFAGPLTLVLVAVWDLTMEYLCFCLHQPIAGYVLIPLIAVSWPLIFRSRFEFLD